MNLVFFVLIISTIFLAGCATSETIGGFDIEKIKELVDLGIVFLNQQTIF